MKRLASLVSVFCVLQLAAQQCIVDAGPDTSLCQGQSVSLQATGIGNYQWSPAAGLSCTACASPVASPAATTTYVLTGSLAISAAVNGDFSQGNTGFGSAYQYNNVSIWNEGTYWVGNNPNTVHPNFGTYGDHTTGTGNYLIVNGAGIPGVDVWCQTVTIPANTQFTFSCWGLNLSNPAATLQFSINGVPQGNTFSLSSTIGIWTQYSATWNSGANTSVTICIQNMNTAVGGNDFGLDDIAFTWLCSDTDSVVVAVNPLPVADFSVSSNIGCLELCPVFTDLSSADVTNWNWDFGDGNTGSGLAPAHCYNLPGQYDVSLEVITAAGCRDTLLLNDTVTLYPAPNAAFGVSAAEVTITSPEILFNDQSTNGVNWNWNFGDGNTSADQDPQHSFSNVDTFLVCLVVQGPMGCADTACMDIVVQDEWTVYVPNAFTPNSDGLNDVFSARGDHLDLYAMKIFDRWGMLLFETNDLTAGWDGKFHGRICQPDVYVYRIEAGGNGETKTLTGQVVLVR